MLITHRSVSLLIDLSANHVSTSAHGKKPPMTRGCFDRVTQQQYKNNTGSKQPIGPRWVNFEPTDF